MNRCSLHLPDVCEFPARALDLRNENFLAGRRIRGNKHRIVATDIADHFGPTASVECQCDPLGGPNRRLDDDQIRPGYRFDVSCQGSVPESIIAFLDSSDFEDAVRKAVSLGGDSDTMACMAGAIAEAYYGGVSKDIAEKVRTFLTDDLWDISRAFCDKYYDLSIKTLDG